jgi:hypothetical protein
MLLKQVGHLFCCPGRTISVRGSSMVIRHARRHKTGNVIFTALLLNRNQFKYYRVCAVYRIREVLMTTRSGRERGLSGLAHETCSNMMPSADGDSPRRKSLRPSAGRHG